MIDKEYKDINKEELRHMYVPVVSYLIIFIPLCFVLSGLLFPFISKNYPISFSECIIGGIILGIILALISYKIKPFALTKGEAKKQSDLQRLIANLIMGFLFLVILLLLYLLYQLLYLQKPIL